MASVDDRPRLAFRVGVTGKRNLTELDMDAIRPRIRELLAVVKGAMEGEAARSHGVYSDEPPLLRAVSPLAEGADRVFAEEALVLGYTLEAPLPFHRVEYAEDFSDSASRAAFDGLIAQAAGVFELDGRRESESEPYETVGRVVLDHCDLLMVVWDGKPAGGKGGTAQILEMARQRQIPVVCIGIAGLADRFYWAGMEDDRMTLSAEALHLAVARLVRPPWLSGINPDDADMSGSYVGSASGKPAVLGVIWSWFVKGMLVGVEVEPTRKEQIPDNGFTPPYKLFDSITNRFAGLYRGAFLANYSLGLAAVWFALLGYAHEGYGKLWLWSELAAIAIILLLIFLLGRRRWHFRSIDCRYLTEHYRILCFIYPLGLTAPPLRLPAHHLHSDVQRSWMEWRLRASLRQEPMPAGTVNAAEVQGHCARIVGEWIDGQITYHQRNEVGLERIEKRLDGLVWCCVSAAAVACVLHFFVHDPAVAPWLTLCAAGFPAAAAACHAIATQGEFRRLSERSGAMHNSLRGIRTRIQQLNSSGQLTLATLRRECETLAALMIEEVVDWQILYRKPVPPG